MQEVFSHSSISSFETCPKKYYFRYVEKRPAETESIEGFVGKRVHEILERLYQFADEGRVPSLDRVLFRYHANWDERFDSARIAIVRRGTDISHYRSMGARCIENHYRRHYPFDREQTLGLERAIRVRLDDHGHYRMRGIIDRLVRAPDGAIEIHDYKTSARVPPRRVLDADRQLSLYELAVRQELGETGAIRLVWLYVGLDRVFVRQRTPDELERVRHEAIGLIDRIRNETRWETRKSALCDWCEYRSVCPLWSEAGAQAPAVPAQERREQPAAPTYDAGAQLPLLARGGGEG